MDIINYDERHLIESKQFSNKFAKFEKLNKYTSIINFIRPVNLPRFMNSKGKN